MGSQPEIGHADLLNHTLLKYRNYVLPHQGKLLMVIVLDVSYSDNHRVVFREHNNELSLRACGIVAVSVYPELVAVALMI